MHILYRAEDLKEPPPADCFTDDIENFIGGGKNNPEYSGYTKAADNCVRLYIEVDYDIYQGKGGVSQATDYVTAVFNQVAILYANESINFVINEIVVRDVPDPYSGPSTSDYLYQFRDALGGNYNGDLAHLVGYQGSGGIAYVDVLCNSFYGVAYSDINPTYSNVPAYSWTVEVLTHEIGHNLGSRHTHACVWNGNNTPIDGCGPAAGYSDGCDGPIPDKGTIMSYCHLVSGVGIDFNLGFGPQPGDLIRNRVYNASCLIACGPAPANDAGITAILRPTGILSTDTESPEVELTNFGTETLTSTTINYQLDGISAGSYPWTGSLASGNSTSVILPAIIFGTGNHTFSASTTLPNGQTDESPANDEVSTNFTRDIEQTYYADMDGDGYGDPNNSTLACTTPIGFVSDNSDCNDNDGAAYPGATCTDGDACTTGDVLDANCNCAGTYTDSDGDGVCDGLDVCPDGDDTIDSDGDGIPDYCDCNPTLGFFTVTSLTYSGGEPSSSVLTFTGTNSDVSFQITDLSAITNGKPENRYLEEVTITYIDASGATIDYGTFNGETQNSVNVSISGAVQSITVTLRDAYGGNSGTILSIDLGTVTSCAGLPGNLSSIPYNRGIRVFPNPASSYSLLQFGETPDNALVVITNLLGAQVATYEVQGEPTLRLETQDWSDRSQVYLVTIYLPGEQPITKRLVVAR